MICPNCKATEENLDWRIDTKGLFVWNCFECECEWRVKGDIKEKGRMTGEE